MGGALSIFKVTFGPPQHPRQATTKRATRSVDGIALVIEGGDVGEVGDLPEDGVESVGLLSGLWWGTVSSGLGLCTGGFGGIVGLASVHELVAHELGDDVDVLRRTVVVAH